MRLIQLYRCLRKKLGAQLEQFKFETIYMSCWFSTIPIIWSSELFNLLVFFMSVYVIMFQLEVNIYNIYANIPNGILNKRLEASARADRQDVFSCATKVAYCLS
jgi:hypothetical protein